VRRAREWLMSNVFWRATYMTDVRDFSEAGKCQTEAFAGAIQPAGTVVVVSALVWPGRLIEVDVTASTQK
jgi:enamine deaminase RidA (YjgF/YER057c/UK114 family)